MSIVSRSHRMPVLFAAILLLLGMMAGVLHHHASPQDERDCAVCYLSHAPATPAPAPAQVAPSHRFESIALVAVTATHAREAAAPSSRGPPSA